MPQPVGQIPHCDTGRQRFASSEVLGDAGRQTISLAFARLAVFRWPVIVVPGTDNPDFGVGERNAYANIRSLGNCQIQRKKGKYRIRGEKFMHSYTLR
jgi:hypothetical protein